MLLNQNNVVDAKSVNAALIALKKTVSSNKSKIESNVKTLENLGDKMDSIKASFDNYYTKVESDTRFSPIVHNHDDRYYTETEIDTKLLNDTLNLTSTDKLFTGDANDCNYGVYRVISSVPNLPVANNGYLITYIRNTAYKGQIYISDFGYTYTRVDVGTWSPWQRLATEGDLTWSYGSNFEVNTSVCSRSNMYNMVMEYSNCYMYHITGWIEVKAMNVDAYTPFFYLPHNSIINNVILGCVTSIPTTMYRLFVENNSKNVFSHNNLTFSSATVIYITADVLTYKN